MLSQSNETPKTKAQPTLYLFPVPLAEGEVENVLPRLNIELLHRVKFFVVENLRSARRFLKSVDRSIDIDSLHFTELSEHTPASEVAAMLAPMEAGHDIGVISEAGCPAVADPGADLVAAAQARGMNVCPLVGPSSILMAVMGSGFNGQSFAFNGYLPVEAGARAARLRELIRRVTREGQTQVFIETPYRNNRLVDELARSLPPQMRLCVASDITGPRQSIVTFPASAWRSRKYDYNKIPTIFLIG